MEVRLDRGEWQRVEAASWSILGQGRAVMAEGEDSLTPGCRWKGLLVGKPKEKSVTRQALAGYRVASGQRGPDLASPLYLMVGETGSPPLLHLGGDGGHPPKASHQPAAQAPGVEAAGPSEQEAGATASHGCDGDGAPPSPKRRRRLRRERPGQTGPGCSRNGKPCTASGNGFPLQCRDLPYMC